MSSELPVKAIPLREKHVRQGLRVERTIKGSKRRPLALLTGVVDHSYPRVMAEVIPEGLALSRIEPWPIDELTLLPRKRQLERLGGGFVPPKGYPLVNRED